MSVSRRCSFLLLLAFFTIRFCSLLSSLSCMFLSVLEHFSSGQRLIKEGECCHVTPLSQMSVGPARRPEDRPPLLPDNLLLEDSFSTPARAMPPVWTSLPLSHAQLSLAHVLKSGEPQFPPPALGGFVLPLPLDHPITSPSQASPSAGRSAIFRRPTARRPLLRPNTRCASRTGSSSFDSRPPTSTTRPSSRLAGPTPRQGARLPG